MSETVEREEREEDWAGEALRTLLLHGFAVSTHGQSLLARKRVGGWSLVVVVSRQGARVHVAEPGDPERTLEVERPLGELEKAVEFAERVAEALHKSHVMLRRLEAVLRERGWETELVVSVNDGYDNGYVSLTARRPGQRQEEYVSLAVTYKVDYDREELRVGGERLHVDARGRSMDEKRLQQYLGLLREALEPEYFPCAVAGLIF